MWNFCVCKDIKGKDWAYSKEIILKDIQPVQMPIEFTDDKHTVISIDDVFVFKKDELNYLI